MDIYSEFLSVNGISMGIDHCINGLFSKPENNGWPEPLHFAGLRDLAPTVIYIPPKFYD
jgi:hypothetical protein